MSRFFIVHTDTEGCLTKALAIARAGGMTLNPGSWMRPISIEMPENDDDAQAMRDMLVESGVNFHESIWDQASY